MSRELLLFALLMVASSIVPAIDGNRYLFHLPWACAVLQDTLPRPLKLISVCAIFNQYHVLVSVNNMFARSSTGQRYSEMLDRIYVQSGTNRMNGTIRGLAFLNFAQMKNVTDFIVGQTKHYDAYSGTYVWDEYLKKPITDEQIRHIQKDDFGASYNVGLLKIKPAFVWDVFVRPITMNFLRSGTTTGDFPSFEKLLESETPPKRKCITYSWNEKKNKIRYHEVMYLPRENCLDLFCAWDLINCEAFPNQTYLFCFKANKFADVCPNARGAALYCPSFAAHSIFAILTTAPSCGLRRMPGVYTSLPLVIRLYEKVYSVDISKEGRPALEDPFTLDQKNEDYEGIFA